MKCEHDALCMVQFDLLPTPPGQPSGQVQPFGPWVRGVGQIKNIFSLILRSTCHFPCGLHDGCGPQDNVFQGKRQEFVGEWLDRNNLSKLKSVVKGKF